jgi:hypothetical protein
MTAWKMHLASSMLTLIVAAGAVAWWWGNERDQLPLLARVDIARLVAKQQQSLVDRVKPGIDGHEQARIFEDAKAFGRRLDGALEQVSRECGCALMNSAALLKVAEAGMPDLTDRVEALVGASSPVASGQ